MSPYNIVSYNYVHSDLYNNTVREFFSHQRMEDCHLEIFSMCQEGMISINEMKIDFDDSKPEF